MATGQWTALGTAIAPGLGTIAGGGADIISSLFTKLKGKTKHMSYDAVLPKAQQFQGESYNFFRQYLTDSQIVGNWGYLRWARDKMMNAMRTNWGLGPSLNLNIYTDVGNLDTNSPASLNRLLGYFYVWVWTNVNEDSDFAYNAQQFRDLFNSVFKEALSSANLADVEFFDTTQTGTLVGPVNPTPSKTEATLGTAALGVLAIGAALYFFTMKGK